MNIKEIYILNRALDGKDIPFLPTYNSLKISNLMVDAIKDGMMKKGFLVSPSEFSDLGIAKTKLLLKYKQAKKHIKINNLCLGVINESKSVLIKWNQLFKEYSISMINSTMGANQIKESYDFLNHITKYTDEQTEIISFNDLKNVHDLSSKANFFNLTTTHNGLKTNEIYFESKNKLYIYDLSREILEAFSQKDILNKLNERMCL